MAVNKKKGFNMDEKTKEKISPSNFDYLDKINEELGKLPPYTRHITRAMIVLADAVSMATNLKDRPVLDEMKKEIDNIFKQANEIINEKAENVH